MQIGDVCPKGTKEGDVCILRADSMNWVVVTALKLTEKSKERAGQLVWGDERWYGDNLRIACKSALSLAKDGEHGARQILDRLDRAEANVLAALKEIKHENRD